MAFLTHPADHATFASGFTGVPGARPSCGGICGLLCVLTTRRCRDRGAAGCSERFRGPPPGKAGEGTPAANQNGLKGQPKE